MAAGDSDAFKATPAAVANSKPPQEAIDALLAPSTKITRRVDIYEEDGITPFRLDAPFIDGNVNVDSTRAERRSFDLILDNSDGTLSHFPGGFWYDKVIKMYRGIEWEGLTDSALKFGPGTAGSANALTWGGDPLTWSGEALTWGLETGAPDSYMKTADSPSHNLLQSDTLTYIGWFSMEDWSPAAEQCLLSKWGGSQKAFKFSVLSSGALRVGISTNGTNELFLDSSATGFANGTFRWIRIEVDMNNGSGGKTAKFFSSLDGTTWTQIGSDVSSASLGTTTYFDSSEPIRIGATGSGDYILSTHRKVKLFDGLRFILDLDFTSIPNDTHSLLDEATGAPWQLVGTSWSIIGGEFETKSWEAPLGHFLIDRIDEDNFPYHVRVSGRDLTKKLLEAQFGHATSFPEGASVESVIKTIALNGGINKFVFPTSEDKVLGKVYTFEGQDSRWKACDDLAKAFNYELFINAQGYLVLRPFRDPSTSPVFFRFETGEIGSIAKFSKSADDTRIYNQVVVKSEASNITPIVAVATNSREDSPTSTTALKRTKTYNYSSPFFTTLAQAQTYANNLLKIVALESYEVNMETLVLPWLEAAEIVEFIDPLPNPGDPTRFLLSSFSVPLRIAPMGVVARRVRIVS